MAAVQFDEASIAVALPKNVLFGDPGVGCHSGAYRTAVELEKKPSELMLMCSALPPDTSIAFVA